MTRKPLCTLIAGLFLTAPAWAQTNNWLIEASGTVGYLHNSTSSADASRFQEYQDLGNGVISNVFVRGRSGTSWFDGYGENFGRDDQYMMLEGGVYDMWKTKIYYDQMPHEFLFNGKSPFTGLGSNNLVATFPQPNPATWNTINLGYKRTDQGGYFEWQGNSPWFIRFDANEVKYEGTKPGSGALGTSPGNGFIDLMIPVQYNTKNFNVEGGYNTGNLNLSLAYLYSKFDNDFSTLTWTSPFFGNNVDTTFLPPDNHFQRVTLNATWRGLPWQSTLAARYTWSEMKSTVDLAQNALNSTAPPFYGPTDPNVGQFNGKIDNQTFALAWAAHPVASVDTRVYYNWYKRDNDSTQVVYGPDSIVNCGGPCQNLLYQFTKNNWGFDAYWRFAPGNRLGVGYNYLFTSQNRPDYDSVKNQQVFVEWKNNAIENLSMRFKYSYLQRRSNYLGYDLGVDANDPEYLFRFTSAFDSAPVNQNAIKFTADWDPMPMTALSLELRWLKNDYQGIVLGRSSDEHKGAYLSGSYGAAKGVRFSLFGDIEHITYDSDHRQIGTGSCNPPPPGNGCFDPNTPPNSSAYNWSANNSDHDWSIGVGVDWPVTEAVTIKGSILYYETNGSATPSSQNNYGNPLPITAWDDSKHTTLNLKGIWAYDKNWSFTLGYAYDRWRYSDQAYNGYQHTIPYPGVTNNTGQSYLNGYLAFTNYTSNIVYVMANYKFNNLGLGM